MKTKTENGFSIVELLVAIVVGSMLILSTNAAITNYVHLGKQGRDMTLANSFVEGKAEELRSIGYNGLSLGNTDITSQLPSALQTPRSAAVDITSPSAGIKKVDISVTYSQGGTRSYSYTTYIGELGVGQ